MIDYAFLPRPYTVTGLAVNGHCLGKIIDWSLLKDQERYHVVIEIVFHQLSGYGGNHRASHKDCISMKIQMPPILLQFILSNRILQLP